MIFNCDDNFVDDWETAPPPRAIWAENDRFLRKIFDNKSELDDFDQSTKYT